MATSDATRQAAQAPDTALDRTALDRLDAAAVRRWIAACVRTLDEHRAAIDGINVFPVADRDTGSNLLRTVRAAAEAVARTTADDPVQVWSALAGGALAGARGNSGVILSQVLRGLAEVLADAPTDLAAALLRADELATRAVSDPAPGTVLSVLHAAATAANKPNGISAGTLAAITRAAADVAAEALAETPSQLDVLARAGVVDAGAQGLVLVLRELATIVDGVASAAPPAIAAHRVARDADALFTEREAGSPEFGYEVMYSLDATDEHAAESLRRELRRLGDCVSVVGDGGGRWTVHVHCNDVGAAIEAGIEIGRPRGIAVVRFDDQAAVASTRFAREHAVVALARGAATIELFRAEGAAVLPLSEDGFPDPAELVAVIAGTQASHVVVLPNEPGLETRIEDAVAQAARAGQDVLVVPTASPVQGLAALAVHDAGRRAGEDVVAMAEAAAATRRGELTIAREEALTWVGQCHPDDVLGLLDGEVVLVEPGPAGDETIAAAAAHLLDRMLVGGGELVTALIGAGAPDGLADALDEHVRAQHWEVELSSFTGDQVGSVLLLGVE
ncbi:MAG TPA: DAK2 domain-containing protein [Pseudonocardiaceae bacterium]|nr:DAK2 domain-containing protein [Pseudonocardiaceae bacterium]